MTAPILIALLGAESTGKTVLAQELQASLAQHTGLRCALVGEYLRNWCNQMGRTPDSNEQLKIAQTQAQNIEDQLSNHDVVICDTTPLMIAVYSDLLFQDSSLYAMALAFQARTHINLLMALDLPWVADGIQRDGPHVRGPVDAALRQALLRAGQHWSLISGAGNARLSAALDAITPILSSTPTPQTGLLTRLAARNAANPQWRWVCEKCDVPQCEHQLLNAIKRSLN